MVLSDRDLRERLESKSIIIDPLDDPDLQIQPASVDLRLDKDFIVYRLPHLPCIDPRSIESLEQYTTRITMENDEPFILHPGEFALGCTLESVKVPHDLVARVEGRSTFGRLAIVVHATAGFIDPGFEGQITLELSNLGRCAVMLYPGTRISQIVFQTMLNPSERPYGEARGSKYQGQRGTVMSRAHKDKQTK